VNCDRCGAILFTKDTLCIHCKDELRAPVAPPIPGPLCIKNWEAIKKAGGQS
jgi:hypothetical protein